MHVQSRVAKNWPFRNSGGNWGGFQILPKKVNIQIKIKQESYTKANESGEKPQKRNHGAYRHWAPSVYGNSTTRIESKIQ